MKRFTLAALFGFPILATGWISSGPARKSCKPTPPIELEARLVGDPGGPFAVTARASSKIDAEIELDCILPDGVTVLGGEAKRKNKRPELKLDLRARDRSPREIFVRATIESGGARLTRVVPLALGTAPTTPRGTLRKNSRGETLREFGP